MLFGGQQSIGFLRLAFARLGRRTGLFTVFPYDMITLGLAGLTGILTVSRAFRSAMLSHARCVTWCSRLRADSVWMLIGAMHPMACSIPVIFFFLLFVPQVHAAKT